MINTPMRGDQSEQDLPEETFRCICSELEAMGTEYLVLTGEGEPFLHSRLVEFVSFAKEAGLEVIIFTNGTLMDEARLRGLVDAGLDIMRVSLWGSSEEEYRANYPGTRPGTFEKIVGSLKGLRRIKKEKGTRFPLVSLHRPIDRDNCEGVAAMVNLAHATGADKVSFSPFKTRRGELNFLALSDEEEGRIKATLRQMDKRLSNLSLDSNIGETVMRYDIGESVWEKLPCYMGWIHMRIKLDGTVFPCNPCPTPVGSLRESTLAEIWQGQAIRDFRRQTITRQGLRRVRRECDCTFCCHAGDNARIHGVFKWFSPFRHNGYDKKVNLREDSDKTE